MVSSASDLNGPRVALILTLNCPVKPFGTRHEYVQVPPHPYSNLPWARTLLFPSRIWNCGAGTRLLPMYTDGL